MPYTNEIEFSHSTTITYEEELIVAGKGWRIGAFFEDVAAEGYCSIVFKTPADKKTIYKPASVGKTGGEALLTIIEAPTIGVGGSNLTPFQLNRNKASNVCSLVDVRSGDSTAMTVTAGIESPADYLAGENQGGQRSPSTATSSFIYLKPDTYYAVKVLNIGSATSNINILMTLGVDV